MSTEQLKENLDAKKYDFVIVGGGMVGASLCLALVRQGFYCALIESKALDSEEQASFDERTVALTYSSKLIFEQLGLWSQIEQALGVIEDIDVTNANHFGFSQLSYKDISNEQQVIDALGYVVSTQALGQALYQALENQAYRLDIYCPAQVLEIDADTKNGQRSVSFIHDKSADTMTICAPMVVLADGGRSHLLDQLNIQRSVKDYPQKALVTLIEVANNPNPKRAYEHFCDDGPLALLPFTNNRYALVWTLSQASAEHLMCVDDESFLSTLKEQFGSRAGTFLRVGKRQTYPLQNAKIDVSIQPSLIVMGNAVHTVHPVAGQGFNLSLRDIVSFVQIFAEIKPQSLNDFTLLQRYQDSRKRQTQRVNGFTEGMIGVFAQQNVAVVVARNIGLSLINICPPMKRFLLRRTMGLTQSTYIKSPK